MLLTSPISVIRLLGIKNEQRKISAITKYVFLKGMHLTFDEYQRTAEKHYLL